MASTDNSMRADAGRLAPIEFAERHRATIVPALIGAKAVLLFLLAWNSRFVMDEFAQLGYAKYFSHGLFNTVWPSKAVGYTAFAGLAHAIGWNAVSILLTGRMLAALLAVATLAMIYGCARAIGETRTRAMVVVLGLLSFSNFMERIFETRAEPLAVFFAVAALLVIVRRQTMDVRTMVLAGVFSGLSFLATQKAVYFNVALGSAIIADAILARQFRQGVERAAALVLGWLIAVVVYCLIFGGTNPLPIAANLISGPAEVATRGGSEYGGLRQFVGQTLARNAVLYAFCFSGMALSLWRIGALDHARRIALIFSLIITVLVFAHDQPWPYVFIMALPFLALWMVAPFDMVAGQARRFAIAALIAGIALSFLNNAAYLRKGNSRQLDLIARAEALVGPDDQYFDGIGMLPNRQEPSTLWLDVHYVLKTLREDRSSEAYQILSQRPPKVLLWSYRMEGVLPVIRPIVEGSYVIVSPNIRVTGRKLEPGKSVMFKVPIAGSYGLFDMTGKTLPCRIEIDGKLLDPPFHLETGTAFITLQSCPSGALVLPQGNYENLLDPGGRDVELFDSVYD